MKLKVRLFGKNYFIEDSTYSKKVDYNNYYSMNVLCVNCNNGQKIYIKKGVYLTDVITAVKCNNCECRLEKKEK